ncbi:MAG: molybdopterin-dependent oxidoreductase [Candidatus Hydrogenedentes bacterium]|nr:molybdopterin-dependent oxidoreductase [Candidatus Hydrogenedentota bacterium]
MSESEAEMGDMLERPDEELHSIAGRTGAMRRREFLKYTGGGILVFFFAGDSLAARGDRDVPADFNAFLHVGEDGRVTCFTGKIEMGQGIITSLAQMLADELDVPFESVDMVMGDTALCPFDRGTFGSMTTRFFGPPLRKAGAEARAVLLELAAEQLKTPVDNLEVKDGVVFVKGRPENKVTYAQLTQGKRIERHLNREAQIKEVSQLNEIGKPRRRTTPSRRSPARRCTPGTFASPAWSMPRSFGLPPMAPSCAASIPPRPRRLRACRSCGTKTWLRCCMRSLKWPRRR